MERKGFIGGSDMRRIMDGQWVDLWEEKLGLVEPEDLSDNLAVQLGTHTEDFNIKWFEKNFNTITGNHQQEYRMQYENAPLKATIDGVTNDGTAVVECKHTYERNTMEGCLKMYMPQIQFYLWVSVHDGCYLSVIFGNRRWECVYVQKDWDYIKKMQVMVKEFWQCVQDNTRPFGDNLAEPVSIDNIKVDGLVRRDASSDNEFISRCHDYIQHETNAKLFESAKSDLKAMVGDDEREVYCDLLSIKRDKRGSLRVTVKENQNV